MKERLRLSFYKGDLLAIALVGIMAVGTAFAFAVPNGMDGEEVVQIYLDGRLVEELPLARDTELEVSGQYSNTVEISDGRAAIVESDCPGEDCVHSGWIDGAGRSIVCLPNRVEVRIVGEAEVDFTVR